MPNIEIRPGYVVEFPDSMNADSISAHALRLYNDSTPDTATVDTTAGAPADVTRTKPTPGYKEPLSRQLVRSKGLATAAGGMAGAAIASPLAPAGMMLGAGLGGMVGGPPGAAIGAGIGGAAPLVLGAGTGAAGMEAYRQLLANALGEDFPMSSGEAAKGIGASGGIGALQEIGGQLLSGGAKFLGRNAVQLFRKLRPEDAAVAMREGIGLTKGGAKKAADLLEKTTQAERQIAIQARNTPISTNDIADEAYKNAVGRLQGADQGVLDALAKKHAAFLKGRGVNSTPEEVLSSRQFNDRAASNLRQTRAAGKIPNPSLNEIWREELANASRRKLRDAVPSVTDPETYRRITGRPLLPSEIVPLASNVAQIVNKSPSVAGVMFRRGGAVALGAGAGYALAPEDRFGGAIRGGLVGGVTGAAATPQMVSRLALAAHNPAFAQFLVNLPRIVGATQ